jgi:hypothetical protein
MAKNEKTPTPAAAPNDSMDGYQSVSPQGRAPWYRPADTDVVVEGPLMGKFQGPNGDYVQVKVIRPCLGHVGKDDVKVDVGGIINVGINTFKLQGLGQLADEGGWQIFIQSTTKTELNNGHSLWDFKVGKKSIGAHAVPPAEVDQEAQPF